MLLSQSAHTTEFWNSENLDGNQNSLFKLSPRCKMKPGRELGTKIKYLMISQPFQNHSLMLGEIAAGSALNFTISSAYLKKKRSKFITSIFLQHFPVAATSSGRFSALSGFCRFEFLFLRPFSPFGASLDLAPKGFSPQTHWVIRTKLYTTIRSNSYLVPVVCRRTLSKSSHGHASIH